jgi:hypothetical protein
VRSGRHGELKGRRVFGRGVEVLEELDAVHVSKRGAAAANRLEQTECGAIVQRAAGEHGAVQRSGIVGTQKTAGVGQRISPVRLFGQQPLHDEPAQQTMQRS